MTRRPPRLTTTSTLLPRTMRFLALLPPFAGAASDWRDGCFDCLVLDPFGGTQPPRELILLARGIAARRPLLILSDRDSRADRMLALGAGADEDFEAEMIILGAPRVVIADDAVLRGCIGTAQR